MIPSSTKAEEQTRVLWCPQKPFSWLFFKGSAHS
jgi:hypothetical protein